MIYRFILSPVSKKLLSPIIVVAIELLNPNIIRRSVKTKSFKDRKGLCFSTLRKYSKIIMNTPSIIREKYFRFGFSVKNIFI